MYKLAAKSKLRFQSTKGILTVEDLFDLSLKDLDAIFKFYNKQKKDSGEESLLGVKSTEDSDITLRIEILKDVVATKQEEAEKARIKSANRIRKTQIMDLIAKKEQEKDSGRSLDDLLKELETLD